jgi:hypothetical protein
MPSRGLHGALTDSASGEGVSRDACGRRRGAVEQLVVPRGMQSELVLDSARLGGRVGRMSGLEGEKVRGRHGVMMRWGSDIPINKVFRVIPGVMVAVGVRSQIPVNKMSDLGCTFAAWPSYPPP